MATLAPKSVYELPGLWRDVAVFDAYGDGGGIMASEAAQEDITDRVVMVRDAHSPRRRRGGGRAPRTRWETAGCAVASCCLPVPPFSHRDADGRCTVYATQGASKSHFSNMQQ